MPNAKQNKPPVKPGPHDADAERTILGAVLITPRVLDDLAEFITAEDFGVAANASIWAGIIDCDSRNQIVDRVTIAESMRLSGTLETAGGVQYINQVIAQTNELGGVLDHARIVHQQATLRRALSAARTIATAALAPDANGEEVRQLAESELFKVALERSRHQAPTMAQGVAQTLERLAKAKNRHLLGLDTGFVDLNDLTAGYQPGQLWTVAARPGMGKSVFALNAAARAARETGQQVVYISYEMDIYEQTLRLFAAEMSINSSDLRKGDIPAERTAALASAAQSLSTLSLVIEGDPPKTPSGLRSYLRQLRRRGPIAMVVVDYIQLMDADIGTRRDSNRANEVSEITKTLKSIARDLERPVLALSQLSRQVENRPDKHPQLSDLRDSGSIESDSDNVVFLYRPAAYDASRSPEEAEIVLAKQRGGPIGVVNASFQGAYMRFRDPKAAHYQASTRPAAGTSNARPKAARQNNPGPSTPF